jgi:hypothetical protein
MEKQRMRGVLAVSELLAPGERATLVVLIPDAIADVELVPTGVFMNPPTAAAFGRPERIDVLTVGETLDLCGELAGSVRIVICNRSSKPARFVASVDLAPNIDALKRDVVQIVERDWRAAYDEAKRSA